MQYVTVSYFSLKISELKYTKIIEQLNSITLISALIVSLFFAFSCTSTRQFNSQEQTTPIVVDGNLSDWSRTDFDTSNNQDFDVAVSNDEEFVYIAINFRNNRTYAMARDFGFRIYLDSDRRFRRSFGIVFPAGIVTGLADFPGARKSYLENPGWRNLPENAAILQSVENEMGTRVQVIRRVDSGSSVRPSFVSKDQLRANEITMGLDQSGRTMSLELKVPIRSGMGRDFGIDPDGDRFYLGFEIEPPDYQEVTGESPRFESIDEVDNQDPYRRRPRSGQQIQVDNPQLYNLLNFRYQHWVQVRLNK